MEHDFKTFREYVKRGEIFYCENCNGPVKTSVVFFGEGMPKEFFAGKKVRKFLIFLSFFNYLISLIET